jgi:hypothetical protein
LGDLGKWLCGKLQGEQQTDPGAPNVRGWGEQGVESNVVCAISVVHINTRCGQNVELLNVKLAVHIVTTGL